MDPSKAAPRSPTTVSSPTTSAKPPAAVVPVKVGFYEVESTIGKGNYAVVKLARHRITKTEVSVQCTRLYVLLCILIKILHAEETGYFEILAATTSAPAPSAIAGTQHTAWCICKQWPIVLFKCKQTIPRGSLACSVVFGAFLQTRGDTSAHVSYVKCTSSLT